MRRAHEEVAIVKHLAMRRTLFVFDEADLPVVHAACSDAVVRSTRAQLVRRLEASGDLADADRRLRDTERDVLAAPDEPGEATGKQLSRAVPALQRKIRMGEGRAWGGEVGVASNVLPILSVEGQLCRGRPNGSWTSSQHRRQRVPDRGHRPLGADEAVARLTRRWPAARRATIKAPATVAGPRAPGSGGA